MKQQPRSSQKQPVKQVPVQKSYQEQERDVYQDYQRRKAQVRAKLTHMINRTFDDREMRLVEFLDQIQEKIYKNMIAIDPSSFKELVAKPYPPLCFQCAVLALKMLTQRQDDCDQLQWESFQPQLMGHEIEFLGLIYGFQQAALEGAISPVNIMRAKNELIKYIVEGSLSEQSKENLSQKIAVQIQNMVQLSENIIGFAEVFESLLQSFQSHQEVYHQEIVPASSLQMSPTNEKTLKIKEKPIINKPPSKPSPKPVKSKNNSDLQSKIINIPPIIVPQLRVDIRPHEIQTEIDEIHALLSNTPQEEGRQRIISQLDSSPQLENDETYKVDMKPILKQKDNKIYRTPQRSTKHSDSDSKIKMSPVKHSQTLNDDSRISTSTDPNQYQKLKEAIKINESNIKLYVKEQLELKWKIEKETKMLEKNLEKLQELDEINRQNQWRNNTMTAKIEQERKDKDYRKEVQEYLKTDKYGSCSKNPSIPSESSQSDLQINLKRFHQMLRNK